MSNFVQVAVNSPLYNVFDYLWKDSQPALPGIRVTVPFGRRQVVGVVVSLKDQSAVPASRLRAVIKRHDDTPVLSEEILKLLRWARQYLSLIHI